MVYGESKKKLISLEVPSRPPKIGKSIILEIQKIEKSYFLKNTASNQKSEENRPTKTTQKLN